jgi:Protein of unknown function (DUF2808)
MNLRKQLHCLSALLLLGITLEAPARAIQVGDGTRYFNRVPVLVSNQAYERIFNASSRYAFVISLPADAGEALGRIDIDLGDFGSDYSVDTGRTTVHDLEDQRIAVKKTTVLPPRTPSENPVVSIELAEPLQPGKTAVIYLRIALTPRIGGVQMLGVTAFPAGEKVHGQFLGFGRVNLWDN